MELVSYTIYSTPTCHYCGLLKNWLGENNIAFENKDVATDMAARTEMVEKSQQLGVPVSIIKFKEGDDFVEKVVIGFDQPQIGSLLNISA